MSASWSGNMRALRVKAPLLLLLLLLLTTLTGPVCGDETDGDKQQVTSKEINTTHILTSAVFEATSVPTESSTGPELPTESDSNGEGSASLAVSETTLTPTDSSPGTELPTDSDSNSEGSASIEGAPSVSFTIIRSVVLPTDEPRDNENATDDALNPVVILIPVVLVVLIIGMIVGGVFINRIWNKKGRNPELDKDDPCLDGSSTEKVPMPMFEEDVPSVLELEMEEFDQWMKKDGETTVESKHE